MALRESPADPKVAALRESRCLNPHPRAGHRPGFPGRGVLRPPGRGAGQVRDGAPRQRGAPVTATAAAFGYSRPSYDLAAMLDRRAGVTGLLQAERVRLRVRPYPDQRHRPGGMASEAAAGP